MLLNINRNLFQNFPFHLVTISPWPILVSFSLLNLTMGAVLSMHGYGHFTFLLGVASTGLGMLLWFRDIILEATYLGDHTTQVQKGITIGVILFIVSEVFAFFSVFWAFFHSSLSPSVEIGGVWPPQGIEALSAFGIFLSMHSTTKVLCSSMQTKNQIKGYATVPPLEKDPVQDNNDFSEMKKYSDPMSDTELIESTLSTITDDLALIENNSKKEIISKSINSFILENKKSENADLYSPLYPLLENQNFFKNIETLTNPNILLNEHKFKSTIDRLLNENNLITKTGDRAIEFVNGKLILDLNSINSFIEKLIQFYKDNPELVNYGLPSFGALYIYKVVVNIHAKNAFVDEKTFTDEKLKFHYLKMRSKQVLIFNSMAATVVVASLVGIGLAVKYYNKKSASTILAELNKIEPSKGFIPTVVTKIVKHKYSKILYLFLGIGLISIIPYSSIFNLSIFEHKYIIFFKILLILFTNSFLLFNLFTLFYLNKYSKLGYITFSKYTLNFVKSYLMELYNMSKLNEVNIIIDMVIKNTIICFLLQTVIIIILLVIN